jgi:ligand-binding SRPBCC domain-containing protein
VNEQLSGQDEGASDRPEPAGPSSAGRERAAAPSWFRRWLRAAVPDRGKPREIPAHAWRQFVKETIIDAPPEVVFRFHEEPEALSQLIPPWEKMQIAESSGSLLPGARVVLRGSMGLGLLPIKWVAIHTEYDPPHLFADEQQSGPFVAWHHRHRFLDAGVGRTRLRDEIKYVLPLGRLGNWLGDWLVRRKLERMFAYRHQITQQLIEGGQWMNVPVAR